jgi:hypothetical protein
MASIVWILVMMAGGVLVMEKNPARDTKQGAF